MPLDIRSYRAAFYIQIDRILFQSVSKSSISFMNGSSTLGKSLFLSSVQFQLNHFFDTVFTQYTRHAYAEVFLPVLAFQQSATRNHAFLVAQYGLYHRSGSSTRSIPCRRSQQSGQCSAPHHRVGSNFLQSLFAQEFACK